ncbi:hypothetical protein GCM10029963_41280 [Micromonospora andamanensis]
MLRCRHCVAPVLAVLSAVAPRCGDMSHSSTLGPAPATSTTLDGIDGGVTPVQDAASRAIAKAGRANMPHVARADQADQAG